MKWFRLYNEVLHDRKVQTLPAELFRAWINLLCMASEADPRGVLPPLDDLAYGLRASRTKCRGWLDHLRLVGLLTEHEDGTMSPHNWDERQPSSDDEAGRKRQQRRSSSIKELRQNVPGHVSRHVTGHVQNTSGTVPDVSGTHAGAHAGAFLDSEGERDRDPPYGGLATLASEPAANEDVSRSLSEEGHRLAIDQARESFGDQFARTVELSGPDISRAIGDRGDAYAAAVRKVASDLAKPGARPVADLHALVLSVARRLAREGISPDPVTAQPRIATAVEPSKAERKRRVYEDSLASIDFSKFKEPS